MPSRRSIAKSSLAPSSHHDRSTPTGAWGVEDTPPTERRDRRHKTWAPKPERDDSTPSAGPSPGARSAVSAAAVLRSHVDYENSPSKPAEAVLVERKKRRSQTWAATAVSELVLEATSQSGDSLGPFSRAQTSPASGMGCSPSMFSSHGHLSLGCHSESDGSRVSQWRVGQKIGSGSYGSVFKALHKETGLIFAVKRAVIEEHSEEGRNYRLTLQEEINICKDLRHPNIVSFLGSEYSGGFLYICLEYVPGGSMSSILAEFGPLDESLLRKATRGLLEGLHYLHTRNPPVVHRDIKGANILVALDFCVKLADFGCSKRASTTRSFTTIGSIPWMAPEVIMQQEGYGRKADVWSVGCTLIEMATADKPWGRDAFDNVMYALHHIATSEETPPIPDTVPEASRALIESCVQRLPEARPTAAVLLEHEFVAFVPCRAGRHGGG